MSNSVPKEMAEINNPNCYAISCKHRQKNQ